MVSVTLRRLPEGLALVIQEATDRERAVLQFGPNRWELELLEQLSRRLIPKGEIVAPGRLVQGRWVPSRGVLQLGVSWGAAHHATLEVGHEPGEFTALTRALTAWRREAGTLEVPA